MINKPNKNGTNNYKEIKFGGVAKSSPPSTNFPRRNTTDLLLRKNLGI